MGALRYHYYEIRTVDDEGNVSLAGRSYTRERTRAELFAIQMAAGGPLAKVRYVGGGSNPIPATWAGPPDSWKTAEVEQ